MLLVGVPRGVADLGAEPDAVDHAEALGRLAEVGEDLGLRRVGLAPLGVRRERERVEVARDVAAATGVSVVAPRAADVLGPLEDDVVEAGALEGDRGAEAGEAGADDGDLVVGPIRSSLSGDGVGGATSSRWARSISAANRRSTLRRVRGRSCSSVRVRSAGPASARRFEADLLGEAADEIRRQSAQAVLQELAEPCRHAEVDAEAGELQGDVEHAGAGDEVHDRCGVGPPLDDAGPDEVVDAHVHPARRDALDQLALGEEQWPVLRSTAA